MTNQRKRPGRRYRLRYRGEETGAGVSLFPSPIAGSASTEDMPSSAIGPVYRLRAAPNNSGEDGPPTGFQGAALIVSSYTTNLHAAHNNLTTSTNLMLLGGEGSPRSARSKLILDNPAAGIQACKCAMLSKGDSRSFDPSAGFSLCFCQVGSPEARA